MEELLELLRSKKMMKMTKKMMSLQVEGEGLGLRLELLEKVVSRWGWAGVQRF